MTLTELSKVMQAARLTIAGGFRSQRKAASAFNIPRHAIGRVSDACTILKQGCPELIASVESGITPFATAWNIAKELPSFEQQRLAVERVERYLRNGGMYAPSGIYKGKRPDRRAERAERRIHEAVDKLLDAIMERTDAVVGICTSNAPVTVKAIQAHKWRRTISHCRKALGQLERSIGTKNEHYTLTTIEEIGDGQNDPNSSNNDGPEND